MLRNPFSFKDFQQECRINMNAHQLDGQSLGLIIDVPSELYSQYPFNASAYALMQQLRQPILEFGTLEFPHLPVNKTNYTLAQYAPKQHSYSNNPYLTDICQFPHQDTPPYPTAFWLADKRQFFATWVISRKCLDEYSKLQKHYKHFTIEELHQHLVAPSLINGTGLLFNQNPGLLLIDNSSHRQLFHARTCMFTEVKKQPSYENDSPLYAFNEQGLLHYIDTIDSRRGNEDKNEQDKAEMLHFMNMEQLR